MAYSKPINVFLPTESSDGPIELEMLNWNGKVIKFREKKLMGMKAMNWTI